ncbi:oligosaccharide flippase family protein [Rhizobium sp. BK251]|uniref:oligosaccharide flippase family protein n=1 Tax=Rhizobium sp. BK251 TaxID=2512125 RepID=UPI001049A000|nr:oligosaccharide flippase family protein [Rhizobium sp. BK251]TCL73785.1 O-antigen/teichoic acid export membrane protein [Rhizobium sp. BK251]
MTNLNLKRNSFWAAAEVIVSGVSLFVLYKYIILFLGPKGLGIWALVLATTSLARLGDLGAATALSRFVAIALARDDREQASAYVDTAFLLNLALFVGLGIVLIVPLWYGIAWVVPAEALEDARSLLPYAMLSFVLLNLNAVMLAALIGQQRADLKSMVVIGSVFVQVAVVAACIPHFGLRAMAWGQIAQYIFAAVVARVLFRHFLKAKSAVLVPRHFSRPAFRELFGFGLKLQAANLLSFCFEPFMKFVISGTAGLEALGIFEMTYRMTLQVRNVVAAPTQTLLPAFAHLEEVDSRGLADLYQKAVVNAVLAGGILLSALAIVSPLVSWIWLGDVKLTFVEFAAFCCLGWFLNLAAIPAYLLGVSHGFVRWNLVGHVITSFAGPLIALGLAALLGPRFTVLVVMIGLGGGALFSWLMNCRHFGLPFIPPWQKFAEQLGSGMRFILRSSSAGT